MNRTWRHWAAGALVIPVFFTANFLVHVIRFPSQAAAPLEPYFYKVPERTWAAHGHLFRRHATPILTPVLLAALAQVEASGNPIATTYWRWRWSWNPFKIYAPASSAAGLFQLTDGTFAEARRLCIHGGKVAEQGRWYDWKGCWFNFLYNRLSANHATEMTSAYLHRSVERLAAEVRPRPTLARRQELAAIVHLCGYGEGEAHVRRRFRLPPGKTCGSHSVADYLSRIRHYRRIFARLARRTEG